MINAILAYYIFINILAFALYGIDKRKAVKDKWRIPERVLLLVAIIGGALGAVIGMKVFRHKTTKLKFKAVTRIFLIVHICIAGFFAFTTLQIVTYGHIYKDEKADVAIVLGAATTGKEVKPVFRERINEAIRLYNNGKCEKIIFTGGVPEGSDIADSELAMNYALEQGIPEKDIFIETKSSITEENLLYAKEIMDENGYTSALIVSDPLHMRRATALAGYVGIKTFYPAPTQTSAYESVSTKIKFLNREEMYYVGHLILSIFGR